MADPKVADTKPMMMELEPGTHHWCACGKSKKQPFCDGSHQDTEFTPVSFEFTEKKQYDLWMCKRTANQPYCDGAHTKL